ncbi:MAG: sulfotransferase [Dehalococcoidia bacterium]
MFLITGSGRSGTSAVARLLHEAGLSAGHDLIEPDAGNADGYFEERALVELNDRVMNDLGLHRWFTSASRRQVLETAATRREEFEALAGQATPAWKDPRLCWTLEAWLEVLPETPRMIVCLRSPDEVVASALTYFGLAGDEPERAVRHRWRVQYERLLDVIEERGLEATCVEYGQLHEMPEAVAAELGGFVGRELDASFVRRELRHHRGGVPDDLRGLYERVAALRAP